MSILCIVVLLVASGAAGGAIVSPKLRQEMRNHRKEVSAVFFEQGVCIGFECVREAVYAYISNSVDDR